MKVKTSITLSDELLKAIDRYMGAHKSRSEFLETDARHYIQRLKKIAAERRDLEIIDKCADAPNAEAEDVLGYQVGL